MNLRPAIRSRRARTRSIWRGLGENTQILRLGLLKGMENLRGWTPTQRDEIDGLAGQIITRKDVRPLRNEGKPVGYLYE